VSETREVKSSGGLSINDLVGRGKPLANVATAPSGGGLQNIDVTLLDRNPFQSRFLHDESMLADDEQVVELMADLKERGQLAPVCVRVSPEDPKRFQVIYGHRRSEAFRRLLAAAQTPEEKRKWSHIQATVKAVGSDVEMSALCLAENLQRNNLLPLEEADGIARHKEASGIETVDELAEALNVAKDRVKRLLRLHEAPTVIKRAVAKSYVEIPVQDEQGQPKRDERGRVLRQRKPIELMAALEFAKLHSHLLEKGEKPSKVDERLMGVMETALTEGWSFRRVADYVDGAVKGKTKKGSGEKAAKPARPVYTLEKAQLLIHRDRLGELDAESRAALTVELKAVLATLEAAAQTASEA
jgi:ParB/RepB/Spo0J family partition protein